MREVDLTQVVRQIQESGILWNATQLRQLIAEDNCYSLPKIKVTGFPDIKVVPGAELIDAITSCYDHDGMDETIVICRSNKRANLYNNGIRAQILWREDELNTGDMLMIAKNNYYWTEQYKEMDFIANGEIAVVRRVRRTREIYGFRLRKLLSDFRIRMILNWMLICCWIHCIRMLPHYLKKIVTDCFIPYLKITQIYLISGTE